jgi:hypothetical protein
MRPGKVVLIAALTTIGGTYIARKIKVRVPGFSPQG